MNEKLIFERVNKIILPEHFIQILCNSSQSRRKSLFINHLTAAAAYDEPRLFTCSLSLLMRYQLKEKSSKLLPKLLLGFSATRERQTAGTNENALFGPISSHN